MVFCDSRPKGLRYGINMTKSVLLTTDHLAGFDAFSFKEANINTLTAKGAEQNWCMKRLQLERSKKK